MPVVYLGLGSNVAPEKNLRLGVNELRRRYGDLVISSTYQNAAVGFEGDDFWNLVVGFESDDGPASIHDEIEVIHELAGRQRGTDRYSSRPLDIDLLLYRRPRHRRATCAPAANRRAGLQFRVAPSGGACPRFESPWNRPHPSRALAGM